MLLHKLSCHKGRLLLSSLVLKDADPNQYAVPGVDCVVSHKSRQFADDGHKAFLGHLCHLLRVSDALEPPYCNVHSFSLPPSHRGRGDQPRQLANEPSVKGCKRRRNFGESPKGEVRRNPIPRTRLNKGTREGRGCYAPTPP